jgi:hypothetical protein
MPAFYRVPLHLDQPSPDGFLVLARLDLPLLLEHGGAPAELGSLQARSSAGQPLTVQWLPDAAPSALPRHRLGTLLISAPPFGQRDLELLVQADPAAPAAAAAEAVQIKETADALEIQVEGKPFLTYHHNTKDPEVPRPYFHPVMGPTGKTITQMGEIPGQKKAHHWHTALWISHQKFTQGNNWQIGPQFSRMEHVKFDLVQGGPAAGRFIEELRWLNVKGDRTLLKETRTVTIPRRVPDSRVLDVEVTLAGQDVPVVLEKTPYQLIAVRVLDAMLPKNGGVIVNSEGKKNPGDGERAKWIDVSGKLEGELQGVALFNHPANLRHPTPCLQFAQQTIGLSPTHLEPYTIEPGKSLTLRYRVLVHAGDAEGGKVAKEYEAYEKPTKVRIGGPKRVLG